MIRNILILLLYFSAPPLCAEIVVPNRTLRPGDIVTIDAVRVVDGEYEASFDKIMDVVGQEARTALYANRPILFSQLGPPALIERNQIVQVRFSGNRLMISTEGRALERGGVGDRVKVMNLSSRATLFGFVQPDGQIAVH